MDEPVMDDNLINVLDHGYVRLVDSMGNDLSVVRAARNSFDAAWRTGLDSGSDEKLINYLWKNHHTTPFEAVTFTFEVKAPIFVFRQWHRHRTWSYNELSARYSELKDEFYLPDPSVVGKQSTSNKQGRAAVAEDAEILVRRKAQVKDMALLTTASFHFYRQLLADGWPRELARLALPVATYSKMFATVNLLNLFRFLTLRCDDHAQYEIRVYADAMRQLIMPVVPHCVDAWLTHK